MMSVKMFVGCLLLGTLSAEAVFYAFNWIQKRRRMWAAKKPNKILKILFFPDENMSCQAFFRDRKGCRNHDCRYSHETTSLSQLLCFLNAAKSNLDLCIFLITSPELGDAVVNLHKRGVVVRVIVDSEQIDASGSQIGKFRSEGIQVRHDQTSYFMHHKFAIVDNTILLNGSFNWSRQAITGNNENVLVTNDDEIVQPYCQEFRSLWTTFDPASIL
ncbi:uncharacterized protein LOC141904040 [Tubulanus polymorphus]|uniref:uncharacterized protein LOC141904040 n=1 Tax=Tubulanus polymorphus TaxID=672921 RepID=UPI003DA296BB